MSINKLLDIEEHVWSPMYGLKGNIDATVQVTMQDDQGERTLTVPLEMKTGTNSTNVSHRAQTALYTLLLSDRYGKRTVELLNKSQADPTRRRHRIWHLMVHGEVGDVSHTFNTTRDTSPHHATERACQQYASARRLAGDAEEPSYMQSLLC